MKSKEEWFNSLPHADGKQIPNTRLCSLHTIEEIQKDAQPGDFTKYPADRCLQQPTTNKNYIEPVKSILRKHWPKEQDLNPQRVTEMVENCGFIEGVLHGMKSFTPMMENQKEAIYKAFREVKEVKQFLFQNWDKPTTNESEVMPMPQIKRNIREWQDERLISPEPAKPTAEVGAQVSNHCEDCDPSFLTCWNDGAKCCKKPVPAQVSDTPRTDAVSSKCYCERGDYPFPEVLECARQLERELNAANARIAELEKEHEIIGNIAADDKDELARLKQPSSGMKTADEWIDSQFGERLSPNLGSFTVYGIEAIQADAITAERSRLEKLGGINLSQFEHVTQEYIRQGKELAEERARLDWLLSRLELVEGWPYGRVNGILKRSEIDEAMNRY